MAAHASLRERIVGSEAFELVREFLFPSRVERRAIPPLDGGLGPNDRLEQCATGVDVEAPDDLAPSGDGGVLVSSRNRVLRIDPGGGTPAVVAELSDEVTALASGRDGSLFAAISGAGIARVASDGRHEIVAASAGGRPLRCVTALAVAPGGALLATDGSASHLARDWVWSLMQEKRDGRLVQLVPGKHEGEIVLDGLAWPAGISLDPAGGSLILSQAWGHRVDRLDLASRSLHPLAPNLPGYPARITAAPGGGIWLALFAMRTHLVEFVLRQHEFKDEMMRTIHPDYWIRPDLRTLDSGLIPLQGGGIRKLGITKPWAPPRSYGLVCRLDEAGSPLESLHSRPGGRHHGVTAVLADGADLWVASKGGDRVLHVEAATR